MAGYENITEDFDNSKAQIEMENEPILCDKCFEPLEDGICRECEYYDKLEEKPDLFAMLGSYFRPTNELENLKIR